MDRVLTLTEWNGIINSINHLATTPDSGCNPLSTLPLVTDPHVWAVIDVTAARTKLSEICGNNVFVANTTKWNTVIIDELNSAISTGWCGCGCCYTSAEYESYYGRTATGFSGQNTTFVADRNEILDTFDSDVEYANEPLLDNEYPTLWQPANVADEDGVVDFDFGTAMDGDFMIAFAPTSDCHPKASWKMKQVNFSFDEDTELYTRVSSEIIATGDFSNGPLEFGFFRAALLTSGDLTIHLDPPESQDGTVRYCIEIIWATDPDPPICE